MKRRIETMLDWDFTRFNSGKGIPTNLPKSDESKPVYLRIVSVHSLNNSTEGRIHVGFDSDRSMGFLPSPMDLALAEIYNKLFHGQVLTGHMGAGPNTFQVGFELSRREDSFCDKAVGCVIAVLLDLGIERDKILYPEVTQKTYVWVSKSRAPLGHAGFWGWIEYGKWLGSRFRLYDHSREETVPELR